jgi:septal ring factor EnvC (AmiA/AmiB activator)
VFLRCGDWIYQLIIPLTIPLALGLGVLVATPATAAPPKKVELSQQQKELRGRIEHLRRDLAKEEESRADVAEQLRENESAISDANRGLRKLAERRAAVQEQVRDLESQSRRLAEQTDQQQRQLSTLLHRNFTRGRRAQGDAFNLLLAGRDPNQAALDYHYLKKLSQAKAGLIDDLREKAREKRRLTAAAREKNEEIAAIEQKQQQARATLLEQQRQRKTLLARISDRIKVQRREIGTLRKDEQRLSGLIESLARATRRPPKAAVPTPSPPGVTSRPVPDMRNERLPDPGQAAGAFALLKGKLRLPVRGDIAGRYGKPRPEGGTTWKGLFIRAAEGAEVKAIAQGEVVYSDWLRGFGNLLVVDHGDAFLSVYGNNQSLLKEKGQNVRPGEAIATVGNSGGNPESGLYFELRHRGQAFDPLGWVSVR